MDLLEDQKRISKQVPMPVDDMSTSSSTQSVTGETVSMFYSNAGVRTADAGQAAGTLVIAVLANKNILDSDGGNIGTYEDTSLSFTSTAFTNEVPFPYEAYRQNKDKTWASKLTAVTTGFANGDYCVDYRTGILYGVKASTQSTLTSAAYKINQAQTGTSGGLTSINDAVFTDDVSTFTPGTTKGVNIGLVVDDTGTDTADEGDRVLQRGSTRRAAYVTLDTLLAGEDQTNGTFAVNEKPMSANTYSPDQDTSAAAEASSVTKASAGNLFGVTATNSSGSLRYWQMFNSTTVPADTTVPVLSIPVAAGGEISREWPKGKYFSTGMSWAWSSTAATKTVGSTDGIATVDYK